MVKGYIVPLTVTIENLRSDLADLVESARVPCVKFDNGVNRAGTEVRKIMQKVKKRAHEVRETIQDRRFPDRSGERPGRFKPKNPYEVA